EEFEKSDIEAEPIFQEVSLFSLLEAFRRVLENVELEPQGINLVPERDRIEDKLNEVIGILGRKRQIHFHDLFLPDATRAEIVITFIAVLELIRLKAIRVVQAGIADTILCQTTEAFDTSITDFRQLVLANILGTEPEPEKPQEEVIPDDPNTPVGHG
ncbi:MAG TPA: hypothetical protein VF678_04470, partial [bacterium]